MKNRLKKKGKNDAKMPHTHTLLIEIFFSAEIIPKNNNAQKMYRLN